MSKGILRRTALVGLGGVVIVSLGALVGGWQIPASGPFGPLPMSGTTELWNGTSGPAKPTSATVSTTTGQTRVQGFDGATPKNFGRAPAGFTYILEGSFNLVKATGLENATAGQYWIRNLDPAFSGPDRLIGSGIAPLSPNGNQTYTFYGAETPAKRVVKVLANLNSVNVTDGTATLASVDAGDSTFCAKTTRNFGLSGMGTTATYWVSDTTATMTPLTGSCVCQPAGDTDSAFCDGTIGLAVTFTAGTGNGGPVTVACTGGQPESAALAPGASATFTGNLTGLSWTYSAAGSSISWSLRGN